MAFRFVYGPVPSRRLGRSLGINPIPLKVCNHSCVYCQLGRTSRMTNTRRDYFSAKDLIEEIDQSIERHTDHIDYITFSGEGEPTLCRSLGLLIRHTKAATDIPVAVITNGSLLSQKDVREDLASADLVMPSLDAGDPRTFHEINRPHKSLEIERVVDGLIQFRQMFRGRIWLEVMLVRGINDQMEPLLAIRRALERIQPDRVHFNTPQRPPAESWVEPPDAEGLIRADFLLGDWGCLDRPESGAFSTDGFEDPVEAVLMIIRRHPMRWRQLESTLSSVSPDHLSAVVHQLEREGKVQSITYMGERYYMPGEARYAENLGKHPTA